MADREVPACAISLVALAATFLALVVTDALSDGLSVDGAGTWLSASVSSVSARDLAVMGATLADGGANHRHP